MSFERVPSPTPRKAAAQFSIHVDAGVADTMTFPSPGINGCQSGVKSNKTVTNLEPALPLTTSKMGNQHSPRFLRTLISKKHGESEITHSEETSPVDQLLLYLAKSKSKPIDIGSIDSTNKEVRRYEERPEAPPGDAKPESVNEDPEISRLREQLAAAQSKIAMMDHELNQQRNPKQAESRVALALPSDSGAAGSDRSLHPGSVDHSLRQSPAVPDEGIFATASGKQSPVSVLQYSGYWSESNMNRSFSMPFDVEHTHHTVHGNSWNANDTRLAPTMLQRTTNVPKHSKSAPHRANLGEANPSSSCFRTVPIFDHPGQFGHTGSNRPKPMCGPLLHGWNSFISSGMPAPGLSPPVTPLPFGQIARTPQTHTMPYQPRPIGTPLSPTAMEFNASAMNGGAPPNGNSWNSQTSCENSVAYMPPIEPMNYRRLLDRNMSCNWKYIVDKIVCSNDQQASIFLQQKLKVATAEQKVDLIDAIIVQAYPLMINRFGNFLVQRCFEHGTSDQIIAIAKAIRGNTLNLSMDAFGCHVVQKAFDVVPEDYKATMVHELLRRIPETVIHRYACHVWQKLFELRWSDSPPQIMKYVNEALRGMWHEVALGETGSLVVQNIFENCLDEDKRPCISEVLSSIDIISHGQFGNWCIQHICEQGAPPDRSRATEHVLRFATEYSVDQFASKVIEKCLKVGGSEFLERYLEKVCEGRPDRPRMPLIDIAGDQYGNYLIQYILIHAGMQHRELVATHIRKHMVSLRGSKFGSRVAMLCSNPAFATRPGPPNGMQVHSRFSATVNGARPPLSSQYR